MRLDIERQKELEPQRMENAKRWLRERGIEYMADDKMICFQWKGAQVKFYPYSGWHTGKTIKDGRGFQHLIKQLN